MRAHKQNVGAFMRLLFYCCAKCHSQTALNLSIQRLCGVLYMSILLILACASHGTPIYKRDSQNNESSIHACTHANPPAQECETLSFYCDAGQCVWSCDNYQGGVWMWQALPTFSCACVNETGGYDTGPTCQQEY